MKKKKIKKKLKKLARYTIGKTAKYSLIAIKDSQGAWVRWEDVEEVVNKK